MIRGINYIDETHYECGMIQDSLSNIYVCDMNTGTILPALNKLKTSKFLKFSFEYGCYIIIAQSNPEFIHHDIKQQHVYPYQKIARHYGAENNLKLFTKTVRDYLKTTSIPKTVFGTLCPFTYGIEYETSIGVIPEEECFEKGLIPLRDGSITGNEYTTTILEKHSGVYLIDKHFELLNKYTDFNRDCSLHIHFGNFPLDKSAILSLNNLCACMVERLMTLLPTYAFQTHRYKANGKDYCRPLQFFNTFEDMYKQLTTMSYLGDFHQPHPADPDKKAKWNIPTRYQMCNFINLLCYNGGKTIEFRFLKPTKNKHILYFWLYLLNAFMLFAIKYKHLTVEQMNVLYSSLSLQKIISNVYPDDVATELEKAIKELKIIRAIQCNNGDKCGEFTHFENDFKLSKTLINYD